MRRNAVPMHETESYMIAVLNLFRNILLRNRGYLREEETSPNIIGYSDPVIMGLFFVQSTTFLAFNVSVHATQVVVAYQWFQPVRPV